MNMFNDLAMQAKTQAYLEAIRAEVRRRESLLRQYELRLRQYELTARACSAELIGKGEMARAMAGIQLSSAANGGSTLNASAQDSVQTSIKL